MPTVERAGSDVHYEVAGAGPAIILGPSFLMNTEMWRPQIDALGDEFLVISVDWRGHGQSGTPKRGFGLADLVDDLVAVLDAEGVDRAVWCGLSTGGMVALRAALKVPERVSGIIVMDADAGAFGLVERLRFRFMGLASRVVGLKPLTSVVIRMFFSDEMRRGHPETVDAWRRHIATTSAGDILPLLGALIRRKDISHRLPEIRCPVLVIHGEADQGISVEKAYATHDLIEGSRLVTYPGVGHISNLERPDEVTSEIRRFAALAAG